MESKRLCSPFQELVLLQTDLELILQSNILSQTLRESIELVGCQAVLCQSVALTQLFPVLSLSLHLFSHDYPFLFFTVHFHLLDSGYNETVFEGKKEQAAKVQELLKSKGFISQELLGNEVAWFYT